MSVAPPSLMELEREAAEQGRQYGRERLRQHLQVIADEQGLICPGSGRHCRTRASAICRSSPPWAPSTSGSITAMIGRLRDGLLRCVISGVWPVGKKSQVNSNWAT